MKFTASFSRSLIISTVILFAIIFTQSAKTYRSLSLKETSAAKTGPGQTQQPLRAPAAAGLLTISEFRLRGPNSGAAATDEFIELYNDSNSPLTISSSDGSSGYSVAASDGVVRFVIPNGTVIPARGHFLGVNSAGYSLSNYPAGSGTTATGDATYTTNIADNAGIALFTTSNPANFALGTRLDAVGSTNEANTLYREGAGYVPLSPFSIDCTLYRDLRGGGPPKDTDNNAADFLLADTNGTSTGGQQRLGAPGPENLSSPILNSATLPVGLLDTGVSQTAAPNQVRDMTVDPPNNATFGTVSYRRTFTNLTGQPLTRLRFRLTNVNTFPAASGTADMRARTSSDINVSVSGGGSVLVRGTTLEQPPSQPNGGGFNSSLSVPSVTGATPLAPGANINVQFVFGIQQDGNFLVETDLVTLANPNILTVTNTNDSGAGSLRQAIVDSNNTSGVQTIAFNIPGPGVQTITPGTSLPVINSPIIIDGYTQPGSQANNSLTTDNAVLLIEINGINTGFSQSGLSISAGSSTVRGLVINRFQRGQIELSNNGGNIISGNFLSCNAAGNAPLANSSTGVIVASANNTIGGLTPQDRNVISGSSSNGMTISNFGPGINNNKIQGNFVGLNVNGVSALPNSGQGIFIFTANNIVGGTQPGAGNVISGNGQGGVSIDGSAASGNTVQGNLIGTNAQGTAALGNGLGGVRLTECSNNVIGGATAAARNVISGNGGAFPFAQGIFIGLVTAVRPTGNVVQGNYIGTDVTGTQAIPNSGTGIQLQGAATTTIGGSTAGAGNLIAFNNGRGIALNFDNASTQNLISSNQIFANSQLGIDLGADGVTANDANDTDTGANNRQNFPLLTLATSSGPNTVVLGSLNSSANTTFTIEFFSNPACDSSGNGEGQVFLGSTPVTTDGSGNATINKSLSAATTPGHVVTATATDNLGNTSEFSACRAVVTLNITGRIVDTSGNPLNGVTVNLTGSATLNTTTDVSGNYSFGNLGGGGTYTATPAASDQSFSPASFTFANLDTNRIANFVGTQTLATITGTVTDSNSAPLSNVTISLTKNGTPLSSTQTNGLGNYSFINLEAGANYVVTPTGSFNPASQTLNNLTANAVINFTAAPGIPPQCATASFGGAANLTVGTNPRSIAVADFNGDSKLDLAVANSSPTGTDISVLIGNGVGGFGAATSFVVGTQPMSVAAADISGDGKIDLLVANRGTNNMSVLLGNGVGGFAAPTNFATGSGPSFVVVVDVNSDGKLDAVVANNSASDLSVLLGNGTGGFAAPTSFAAGANPGSIALSDFNGDGKVDAAVTNFTAGTVSILLGNGTGGFGAPSSVTIGANPGTLAVGDFNTDGRADLAVPNFSSLNISVLLGNGAGGFGPATNFAAGTTPAAVAVGDINGDGKLDLVAANEGSNNLSVLLGTGAGSFVAAANFPVTFPIGVVISDFNNDGKSDLASANFTTATVSVLLNNGSICNTQTSISISGRVANAANQALPDVVVTLSGPISRVTQADASGNYSFPNLVPGGNYTVTVQSSYFTFAPSRADFFNLSSSQIANFSAAPLAVPSPTPTPSDDFGNSARDASKWTIGAQTSSTIAFDPQVTTVQTSGQLVVTPLTQASGMHFAGYVSANSFDLRNGSAKVEVVKAGTGGADTIFAVGTDVDNFYRFMVHTPGTPTTLAPRARGRDGIERPLDATTAQLVFQVSVGGQLTSLTINYDPIQHRFMRFRHAPAMNSIVFETSPDNIDFTVQHTVLLQRSVAALTAELSAGTTNPANPGQTVFDNFGLVTSTFQFSAPTYSINEGDGSILVTVTRSGSLTDAATVDFATADGTARQKSKYTNAAGTLTFASGIASRTFRVLLVDNQLAEGEQSLNLLLTNPSGAGLNTPGRAVLTISDNDTTLATGNPLDDAQYFVTQHYYDFLNRVPDQGGLDFWKGQITQCGTDVQCLRTQRITVSNAFFYEQEYQQTGSYVVRLYRAAYGNNQPISNNDNNPNFPNENKKLVNYSVFSTDRARVRGGPSLAQTQLDLANAFVLRLQFLAKYPSTLDGPAYVDALIANINTDIGVALSSQRQALIDLFNQSGRGAVLYRIADDNTQTNPINNRAFIDAEYNRAFVLTQYFGYLRRNPDIGGYLFWLGQVNSAPLRALEKQRAMVCSFITSLEYQQRFSPVATHNNTECQ
ncbi:MAG TPA: FG-GAP-like repeat-containing protein [Pyrinomonadaceae bacterium]|nr:FG-GAP-like repeat-containing protein [Pyrinomonadaceae bacterium]